MLFGRYFMGFCFVFLLVMYSGAAYMLFGWYSVACIVSFICLLLFEYCHIDFLIRPSVPNGD